MPNLRPDTGDEKMMYRKDYREKVLAKRKRQALEETIQKATTETKIRPTMVALPTESKISVKEIIIQTAACHGLTYEDIVGPSRYRNVIKARHEAMKIAYAVRQDMSTVQLGNQFKRDHTTILHAVGRLAKCKK